MLAHILMFYVYVIALICAFLLIFYGYTKYRRSSDRLTKIKQDVQRLEICADVTAR